MKYSIAEDLLLIREYYDLSQQGFADLLGVERTRIARVEAKISYPRDEFLDTVYNYCFSNGLRLNHQKELFYRDDVRNNHILLTHASKSGIDGNIELQKSRLNNDLGRGFYCGDTYEQAVSFICRFKNACVYFVDFDPVDLIGYRFEVNREWMLAIAFFRGKLDKYADNKLIKSIISPIMKADYLIAPIADNRMFQIIDSFINGEITDEQCRHCLSATNLGMQYVYLTDKAISRLSILERCFVSSKEKEYYLNQHTNFLSVGSDKVKLAMIQYRGKGKYVEEILG